MTREQRAVVLLADGVDPEELSAPLQTLSEHGLTVIRAALKPKAVAPRSGGDPLDVDAVIGEIEAGSVDLLLLPGGDASEILRLEEVVLQLVREVIERPGAVVASIGHGPQILISAKVLPGRTVTCSRGIQDDVRLAGARYVDKRICTDGRLLTARGAADAPALAETLVAALDAAEAEKTGSKKNRSRRKKPGAEPPQTAEGPAEPTTEDAPEALAEKATTE